MNDMNNNNTKRNMLVMKASAGSGKTYNLALEYIRHLLFYTDQGGQLRPRRQQGEERILNAHRLLLAITFTNKATAEMKERIVKELYCLAQEGVDSDYLDGFVKLPGMTEKRVRELARHALNELLFDYSNFNVSTIDSFFQSVLRNFARELDRDFNYDIQLEEDYAVRVAVHNFLLSLGKEGKPTQVDKWVKDYQQHLIRGDVEKKKWKFFDDGGELLEFAKQINSELFRASMKAVRAYLGRYDSDGRYLSDFKKIGTFKAQMNTLVERTHEAQTNGLAELRRVLTPYGQAGNLKYTLKTWVGKEDLEPFKDDFLKSVNQDKIVGQFSSKITVDSAVITHVVSLLQQQLKLMSLAKFLQDIVDNLGLLGLLAMIDKFLEDYRHETNTILIGDTNELIGTVLASGSDFVYERVGTTIAHFMIDEFQDTSTKQYENFKGLLHESLDSGNFNMLIGDAKQSIYRFRNADPSVFRERVDSDFKDDIYQPPRDPDAPASTNYRSSRRVIEFNNALFAFMRERYSSVPTVEATYQDVEQGFPVDIDEKKVPGYVRVMLGDYKRVLSGQGDQAAEGAEGNATQADVDVLEVLPHYLLKLHERYDWGRMGVLVNSNREGNAIVECILNFNQQTSGPKISIISGESLLLNNSPIIRRIIAMLRFIDISQFSAGEDDDTDEVSAPEDRHARRMSSKRESDQRLYSSMNAFIKAVTAAGGGSPTANGDLLVKSLTAQSGNQAPSVRDYAAELAVMMPSGYELTTLVSIVENIIARFKNDPAASVDVNRETTFLMAFQDEVMKFSSQNNGGSVREFLKYWDEKKGRLAVSSADGGNAINVMTIHKAKGLEFDCVVIPFAKWYLDGNGQNQERYWMPRKAFINVLESLPVDAGDIDEDIVPPLLSVMKNHLVKTDEDFSLHEIAKDFLDKQLIDNLIDNLNKTYVAFTRPRSELHIFAKSSDRVDDYKLVTGLLGDFASSGGLLKPMRDGDEHWFEYGEISSREQLEAKRPSKKTVASRADIISYPVTPVPPSIKVRLENASTSQIKAGIRLHSMLSRIGDSNDVDRVIADAVKHGIVTEDPHDLCRLEVVNACVREPILSGEGLVAEWFDPANKVYSERTITTPGQHWGEIENLRPDRIVRRPDGQILVIDYKSGERHDSKYCRQVRDYIDKLRAIFPGSPIAGRIWYVTLGIIIDEDGIKL